VVISDNGKIRQELSPGDFALIPAWTEHQEVNDGDEEVTVRKFVSLEPLPPCCSQGPSFCLYTASISEETAPHII
jgi:hypothetical protein